MRKERKEKQILKKGIAAIAKRTAMVEVNTVCPLIAFQPEVPEELKKLRKFQKCVIQRVSLTNWCKMILYKKLTKLLLSFD